MGRFLFFTELDSLSSGTCVSFELRQLSKSSQDADKGDPWAPAARAFYAFACQIGGRILYPPFLTSADSAVHEPLSYAEVGGAKVWDLFTFGQQRYLMVLYGSCAGECYDFQVFRIDPDSLRSVAKVPLWSM